MVIDTWSLGRLLLANRPSPVVLDVDGAAAAMVGQFVWISIVS